MAKHNNYIKATVTIICDKLKKRSRHKRISTQWIGETRKQFESVIEIIPLQLSLLYESDEMLLSLAVDNVLMFVMDCMSTLCEFFFYDIKMKVPILSLIRFVQTFASFARKLFPKKYKGIGYLKTFLHGLVLKVLDIALQTGLMPAAYANQANECKGTIIGNVMEFTQRHGISKLPPLEMNCNKDTEIYSDSDSESDSSADESEEEWDMWNNEVGQMYRRMVVIENCNFDKNMISFGKVVKKKQKEMKERYKLLDECKDIQYGQEPPHITKIKLFKPSYDKFFDWKVLEQKYGWKINKKYRKIVTGMIKMKSPKQSVSNEWTKNAKICVELLGKVDAEKGSESSSDESDSDSEESESESGSDDVHMSSSDGSDSDSEEQGRGKVLK